MAEVASIGSSSGELPQPIVVITGPTAGGKSDLALEFAEALDAEIVGADSRQVVRFMDVGTAKPSMADRERVIHHLIDVVDPDQAYDVATWRADAIAAIESAKSRGKRALVCGGSGLYLRSLEHGLFQGPRADAQLRARLKAEEEDDPGVLFERLKVSDRASALRIHPNDKVRVTRALEVMELTGVPLSKWLDDDRQKQPICDILTLELRLSTAELEARIARRSATMVDDGIVDELETLRQSFGCQARAFNAIGYRQAALVLDGQAKVDGLAEAITLATRRYAKRQRTWLRGKMDTQIVSRNGSDDGAIDACRALDLARDFLS